MSRLICTGMTVIFAYYGTSCANGHLTQAIQDRSTKYAANRCDGRSSCNVVVRHTDADLGDPYVGCPKDFIVAAKCGNGQIVADSVTPEASGHNFELICTGMKVIYAYYGTSCANGHLTQAIQDRSTKYAADRCDGRSSCNVVVRHTDADLGDPYVGCPKDFIVVAKCGDGQIVADSVTPEASGHSFELVC